MGQEDSSRLVKLSADGRTVRSTHVPGTVTELVADGSFVYATLTQGGGLLSAVRKLRDDGSTVWERRNPTESPDRRGASFRGLDVDARGNVYLTGTLSGDPEEGFDDDDFVRKYTPTGGVFDKVFGVPVVNTGGLGIDVAGSSELYVVGATDGEVTGRNNGGSDAFLARLDGQGRKVWER